MHSDAAIWRSARSASNLSRSTSRILRTDNLGCATSTPFPKKKGASVASVILHHLLDRHPAESWTGLPRNAGPTCAGIMDRHGAEYACYRGRTLLEVWRQDYNQFRPHGALGHLTPSEYVERGQKQALQAAIF